MSALPRGYIGHPRDLAKGTSFADPNVIVGDRRLFRRTDGIFVVARDRGEDHKGADRYVALSTHESETEAKEAIRG